MRSTTLLTLPLFFTLATAGCSKDPGGETMVGMTMQTSGDDATGSGGQSETGDGTTTAQTTTAEQPTTSGAGTAGETADPTGFIVTPDGGGGGVECDNWAQDCPADQKCMPWADNGGTAWNATKCVPIDRSKGQPGDECTTMGGAVSGFDTCDLGVMCWDVKPDTMIGTCVEMCGGSQDAPECTGETSCFVSNDGVLNLCLPRCDPLTQDCANDNLCIPNPNNQDQFACVLDASGDNGKAFDACEFVNACDKGFLCAVPANATECDPQAIGCCLPFCDTEEMVMCPGAMQECIAWYEEGAAPPGLESVGFCGIPMG